MLCGWLMSVPVWAQSERPGDVARPNTYAIVNARVVPVAGAPIENGTVVVRDGLIVAVGANVTPPADAKQLDGRGLTIYPGLIDTATNVGYAAAAPAQPGAGGPGRGFPTAPTTPVTGAAPNSTRQVGFQPELLASDLVKATGEGLDAARQAGFTTALTIPREGLFMGRSAIINLAGETPRDLVVRTPVALHINFVPLSGFGYPGSLMGVFSLVRQSFLDAQRMRDMDAAYRKNPRGLKRPEYDPSMAALIQALNGEISVVMYADTEREINRALDVAKEFNLRAVIAGGREADRVAARLKASNTPVLLSLNFPKRTVAPNPEADPEPLETLRNRVAALKTAGNLAKAGVSFAFQTGGATPADAVSNVSKAIQNGLPADVALRALTLGGAELLGIADRAGSIENGKIANLTVTRGDLFDAKRKVAFVFIDGRLIDLRGGNVAPGDIAGTWDMIGPDGKPTGGTITFTREGRDLKGTVAGTLGEGPVDSIFTGIGDDASVSTLTFGANIKRGDQSLRITFNGVYTADEIRGTGNPGTDRAHPVVLKKSAGGGPGGRPGGPGGPGGPTEGANLSGQWSITISLGQQQFPGTLNLRQEGNKLTGTIGTPFGTSDLNGGSITGNGFQATANINAGGQALDITVSGAVTGGRIEGTIVSPQGTATFSGSRPQ